MGVCIGMRVCLFVLREITCRITKRLKQFDRQRIFMGQPFGVPLHAQGELFERGAMRRFNEPIFSMSQSAQALTQRFDALSM